MIKGYFTGATANSENIITHNNSYNLLRDEKYTINNSNLTAQVIVQLLKKNIKQIYKVAIF